MQVSTTLLENHFGGFGVEHPTPGQSIGQLWQFDLDLIRALVAKIDDLKDLQELQARMLQAKNESLKAIENWEELKLKNLPITWRSALLNVPTLRGISFTALSALFLTKLGQLTTANPMAQIASTVGAVYLQVRGVTEINKHCSIFKRFRVSDHRLNQVKDIVSHFSKMDALIDQKLQKISLINRVPMAGACC